MASSKAEPTPAASRIARRLGCGAPILCLILVMPGAGKGAEAVMDAQAVMDAKALGVTESILNYCARVDSGSVPRLRDKVKTMVQGASAAALAQTRKSAQYRAAYASVTDFVAKIDPHNAKRPCTEALADPGKAAAQPGKPAVAQPTRYLPDRFAGQAGRYYRIIWGVDSLSVKTVESGEIIRFTWRVLDADRAKPLSDKRAEPSLVDPQAGVQLVVPSIEQIGQLRQSSAPEAGKSYWMAFSNKGRIVKRGDRVNVVIGQFHADGLVVD